MNIRALKKHLKRLTTTESTGATVGFDVLGGFDEGMIVSILGMKDLYIAFHFFQRRAEQYI